MLRRLLLLLALLGAWCLAAQAAPSAGVVTIVEGKARLLRGANVYTVQEGLVLAPQDIIETDERAHVQVEFADGSAVGVGPKSNAWLGVGPADATHAGDAFLLSGWLKVSGPASAGLLRTGSPGIVLIPKGGPYVLHQQAGQTEFFVETGALLPAAAGKAGAALAPLKGGDFAELKSDRTLNVLKRPTPAFLSGMPRMFIDTLPARYAKFASKKAEPALLRPVVFDEADRWLRGYPGERKALLARFGARLKDKDFRAQVEDNASAYPEWMKMLNADKAAAAAKAAKP